MELVASLVMIESIYTIVEMDNSLIGWFICKNSFHPPFFLSSVLIL